MVDKIKELINKMEDFANIKDFEHAQEVLNQIKEEFKKPDEPVSNEILLKKILGEYKAEPYTIKDVYNFVIGYDIRLNPDFYNFADFLSLLNSVTDKVSKIRGNSYTDRDKKRRIVAEEMICHEMRIPTNYKGIKPNRKFLDEIFEISQKKGICGFAESELARRTQTNLWKAIEKGDNKVVEKLKEELRRYKHIARPP